MKLFVWLLTVFLFSSSAFANFEFNLNCVDENNNAAVDLQITPNGLKSHAFQGALADLNSYSLLSQYSDYGSIQFIWESANTIGKRATVLLDHVAGSQWTGTLSFGSEQIDLLCTETL